MADPNLRVQFTHVPTNKMVEFKAFMESFSDAYNAEWSSEKVFGRMDPIAQYKGTSRVITFSFTCPSEDSGSADTNHKKISQLIQFMYPAYEGRTDLNTYVITAPPLMMVKFNNLIQNQQPISVPAPAGAPAAAAVATNDGLLGYIPDIKYEPDMNSNIFTITQPGKDSKLAFQSFKVAITLNVLHTHRLGWDGSGASSKNFPYGYEILG